MLAIDLFLSSFVSLQLSFVTNNHGYYLTLLLKKGIIINYVCEWYLYVSQTNKTKQNPQTIDILCPDQSTFYPL